MSDSSWRPDETADHDSPPPPARTGEPLQAAAALPAHDAGPTVAEAAADARRWPLEREGE